MTTASPQIPQTTTDTSSGTAVRAVAAFVIGVAMLVVAFTYLAPLSRLNVGPNHFQISGRSASATTGHQRSARRAPWVSEQQP